MLYLPFRNQLDLYFIMNHVIKLVLKKVSRLILNIKKTEATDGNSPRAMFHFASRWRNTAG